MLAERKGSITVSALLGTGLVTLGVALTGVAGLSDDLQAATREATPPTTPLLTPQDEVGVPSTTTPSATPRLDVDCPDAEKSRET